MRHRLILAIGGAKMGLFGKRKEDRAARKGKGPPVFTEKNNVGIRQETLDQAIAYWSMRNVQQKFDPFVLYVFTKEVDALDSLLDLDFIHKASDTEKLICTEPLIFGYYQTEGKGYEAIIAGENLTHELWQKAKDVFEKHRGRRKNDQEPEKQAVTKTTKVKELTNKVKFVRKYTERNGSYYEIHKCDDTELAKDFLMTKSVNKQQYYIVVETPMGNWGMDIKGLYKEHLLPWQTDINSAEIEGSTLGIADSFSLQMAARGINDNFVVKVKCGNCKHEWIEGLRYQNWTVVECPKCQKRNKISSSNYTAFFV
jgi:ssDNA-binding Zn-finger/Zn-ribbon topoisomerase 1